MPKLRRSGGTWPIGAPLRRSVPLSGCTNPAMAISNVVFPDPLGPNSVTNRPAPTRNDTSSSASAAP